MDVDSSGNAQSGNRFPPRKRVRVFPFSESQRNYRFRDEIQFVLEFDSISLD